MSIATKTRAGLAGAAALIALASLSAPSFAAEKAKEEPARCYGINTCKGTSLCATAKNDCKGLNQCKGHGVLVKTPSECKALGGTLTEQK
ncbi:BufA2 family periplasmic bufferin-type metallophore [Pseudoduganella sp. HUAS MS19]